MRGANPRPHIYFKGESMLSIKEMEQITKLLNKAHKHQLLTIAQHIDLFPLKNKMTSEEYIEYMNDARYKRHTKIYGS